MSRKLRLGLFGFGCVGQGLYRAIETMPNVHAEIVKICVKNQEKLRAIPPYHFTCDPSDIFEDPGIDVVVELIDDAAAAFNITKAALLSGKPVITANKKMVAEHLHSLRLLQEQCDLPVLYEGAVCGSIPIIRALEDYYSQDDIYGIEGIFNGSTNFILTRIIEQKVSYDIALKRAQELGFAESDPSLDVLGFDAKYKLVIAMAHAFGTIVPPSQIVNIGIDKVNDIDLKFASENQCTIKLIARAFKYKDKVYGFVAPQLVPNDSFLAAVRNEFNAVVINGQLSFQHFLIGKGAGGDPTALAVLSDLNAVRSGYAYRYRGKKGIGSSEFSNEVIVEAMISFDHLDKVSIGDFTGFIRGYSWGPKNYMVGKLSLNKLLSLSSQDGVGVILTSNAAVVPTLASDAMASIEMI